MTPRIAVTCPLISEHNSFFIVRNLIIKSLTGSYIVTDSIDDCDIQIHVGTPEESQKYFFLHMQKPVVFYTFVESTVIPNHWVTYLNSVTEVWVSSTFCLHVLKDNGVKTPIKLVPLGIDLDHEPKPLYKKKDSNCFTIMWQGVRQRVRIKNNTISDGDRKRGYLVELAFRKLNLPNSILILKSLPPNPSSAFNQKRGNIWRIEKSLDKTEITNLDLMTDFFIWPTRGEGFGLLPLEKLSHGVSVKVTAWSSTLDYLDDFPDSKLNKFLVKDVIYTNTLTKMAEVSLEEVAQSILWAYNNRRLLHSRRQELCLMARKKWNFRNSMAPTVLETVKKLIS